VTGSYSYATAPRRRRPAAIVVGVILGAMVLLTAVGLARAGGWGSVAGASFQTKASWHAVQASVWQGLHIGVLAPWYWAFVGVLTVLQWVWPARRDERRLSVEMAVDAVWFVMGNVMQLTVVAVALGSVTVAYAEVFGGWSLHLQDELGTWGLAVFAFVLADALAWYSHWCHHKVATLWRFHAVHHSQQRLNALSDNRTHVGEVIAAALIVFLPSQVLGLDSGMAMGLAFVGLYYSAMLHSNIRTNLGPLRYVFLGPQPHRIHHAVEPRYFDHNFGTVFPWWDFMAGTYYWGVDEYPATGITDPDFPLRIYGDLNPWCWVAIFLKQLVYPFKSAYRLWVSSPGAHASGGSPQAGGARADALDPSRGAPRTAASGAGRTYVVGSWPTPMAATWSARGCRRQLPAVRVQAVAPS